MKREIYIVTGAGGHLGNTIVRQLAEQRKNVRCLLLVGENTEPLAGLPCEMFFGDVTDKTSLTELFDTPADMSVYVIHCAGIVSITSGKHKIVHDVNVGGTKNVADICLEKGVRKLVYVSSVHAIPELGKGEEITEASHFDPGLVEGEYAKTKAEATQYVLDRAAEGLDASVVHPSGIIGPYDYGMSHMTQLVMDFTRGRLTAGVCGGYDFVDVRDVASGAILAAQRGKKGECYILSNRYVGIPELLKDLSDVSDKKPIKVFLPLWFTKLTAPFAELYYKILRQKPLYTRYSLYTLASNSDFSNEKARRELGYKTRGIKQTLNDMVAWLRVNRPLKEKSKRKRKMAAKI